MKPRLNPYYQAAPAAMNALMALEAYVQGINSWNRVAIGFRALHPTKSA